MKSKLILNIVLLSLVLASGLIQACSGQVSLDLSLTDPNSGGGEGTASVPENTLFTLLLVILFALFALVAAGGRE